MGPAYRCILCAEVSLVVLLWVEDAGVIVMSLYGGISFIKKLRKMNKKILEGVWIEPENRMKRREEN